MMIGIISLTMKSAMVILLEDMIIGMTMRKMVFMMMMKIFSQISNLR